MLTNSLRRATSYLSPLRIVPFFLFRFATEIEVWEQAPVFMGTKFVEEDCGDPPGHFRKFALSASSVSQNDPKKNGRFTR